MSINQGAPTSAWVCLASIPALPVLEDIFWGVYHCLLVPFELQGLLGSPFLWCPGSSPCPATRQRVSGAKGAVGSRLQPGEKVPIWAPRCCSPSTWQVAWDGAGAWPSGQQGVREGSGHSVPFLCHSTSQEQQRFLPSLPAPTWKTWVSCGPGLWSSDSQHQISAPQEPRIDPRRGMRP